MLYLSWRFEKSSEENDVRSSADQVNTSRVRLAQQWTFFTTPRGSHGCPHGNQVMTYMGRCKICVPCSHRYRFSVLSKTLLVCHDTEYNYTIAGFNWELARYQELIRKKNMKNDINMLKKVFIFGSHNKVWTSSCRCLFFLVFKIMSSNVKVNTLQSVVSVSFHFSPISYTHCTIYVSLAMLLEKANHTGVVLE